jgi:phytoene synthase
MPGEIRLQWWNEVVSAGAVPAGNPVATALVETMAAFSLPAAALERLIEARRFDLYDDPMPSLNDLEGYAGETSSALIQLAAIVLSGGHDPGTAEAAGHAGVAYAVTGLLRSLPLHASRGQCYLPADLMSAHGAERGDLLAGRATPALRSLLAEMRAVARRHASTAEAQLAGLPSAAKAAFLPLGLVGPVLDRMDKTGYDPFRTPDMPAWRRQWILWRAARQMGSISVG